MSIKFFKHIAMEVMKFNRFFEQQRNATREIGHSCYSVMAPEKRLLAWSSKSLCVVNDQPVGNPKRKV
jgi:hypothetical protein